MGNAVFIAFFLCFPFLGEFTFVTSSGMVVLMVAGMDVLDTLLFFVDAVDMPAMALFDGRLSIVTPYLFLL